MVKVQLKVSSQCLTAGDFQYQLITVWNKCVLIMGAQTGLAIK